MNKYGKTCSSSTKNQGWALPLSQKLEEFLLNLNVLRTGLKEAFESWVLFVWDVAEKGYEMPGLFLPGRWVKESGEETFGKPTP